MLERFKARGFLPAAHSTPEPQKHEQEAVVQKEVSPAPGQEPALPEEERARQCQQPSSERETSSVEDTAKVTGAAPVALGPAEPAAAADNRAQSVAAAAVPAAESGAETSLRRDSECPEARERSPGARDRGARHREGSSRWEDRNRDPNQRKERGGDRQVTPLRRDTRDRHRSKHRSRSHDRGRSRDRTRHRISSNRSHSCERHHKIRNCNLYSDRDGDCAPKRKGDYDRHRGRHPKRDREIDPKHGRHQALNNDRVREWDRPKLGAAALLQRSHPTLAIDDCKTRKAPSRWEPHEAHSPTRAPSPTAEADGSKRHRTDSPQPQRAHTPSTAAAADDRSGAATAAGDMTPAAVPDGASNRMSMSPPPPQGGPDMAPRNPFSPAVAGTAVAVDAGDRRRLPSPAPSAKRYRCASLEIHFEHNAHVHCASCTSVHFCCTLEVIDV